MSNTNHPLLNPDSKHYEIWSGTQAVEMMERMFSDEELIAWCKVTIMKYRLRIGKKDAIESDAKKIATYEAYLDYLQKKVGHV